MALDIHLKNSSSNQTTVSHSFSKTSTIPISVTEKENLSSINSQKINCKIVSHSSDFFRQYEYFDILPKTDYTYSRSGSYNPQHFKTTYVNPNMSRRRVNVPVTSLSSMLNDSDCDLAMEKSDSISHHAHDGLYLSDRYSSFSMKHCDLVNDSKTTQCIEHMHNVHTEKESPKLISDVPLNDIDSSIHVNIFADRNYGQNADGDRQRISKENCAKLFKHYYNGIVLRSGSHLNRTERPRKTRIRRISAASTSTIELSHSADSRQRVSQTMTHNGCDGLVLLSDQSVTSTDSSMSQLDEVEEGVLQNVNNNARGSGQRRGYGGGVSGQGTRLEHIYGLDQDDDFSDTDSFSFSSLDSSSTCYSMSGNHRRRTVGSLSFLLISTLITNIGGFVARAVNLAAYLLWHCLLGGTVVNVLSFCHWLRRKTYTVARCFVRLDAWMLTRRPLQICRSVLPFLILPLLVLAAGPHIIRVLSSGMSVLLTVPTSSHSQHPQTHAQQDVPLQSVNLHREVKQIMVQIMSEKRDWMTQAEIRALFHTMFSPELESLRVSLLNIAHEANNSQTAMKVNQNDAKIRLLTLEEQMAMLHSKAKIIEEQLATFKDHLIRSLTSNSEKYAADLSRLEANQASMKSHLHNVESRHTILMTESRARHNHTNPSSLATQADISRIVGEMFGYNPAAMKDQDGVALSDWMSQKFVEQRELDHKLRILTADVASRIHMSSELRRSGVGSFSALSNEDMVRLIVEEALMKYSADRTGLPDYALESAGGSVVSVRCSETYYRKTALLSLFGIPLWYAYNSPRTVIQPDVYPGQCWAFKGSTGYIVLQLAVTIRPTSFSLEHIPKLLSTTGSIDSAPKDFTVLGLSSEADTIGKSLGNYTYHSSGKPIQNFNVHIHTPGEFSFVELRVLSNHGNNKYTCIYRFRVHGIPQN